MTLYEIPHSLIYNDPGFWLVYPLLDLSVVYTDLMLGRFTIDTRDAARRLVEFGYRDRWIQMLANGNIEHPDLVIANAKIFYDPIGGK